MHLDRRLLVAYVTPAVVMAVAVMISLALGHDPDLTGAALIVGLCWLGTAIGQVRRHRAALR